MIPPGSKGVSPQLSRTAAVASIRGEAGAFEASISSGSRRDESSQGGRASHPKRISHSVPAPSRQRGKPGEDLTKNMKEPAVAGGCRPNCKQGLAPSVAGRSGSSSQGPNRDQTFSGSATGTSIHTTAKINHHHDDTDRADRTSQALAIASGPPRRGNLNRIAEHEEREQLLVETILPVLNALFTVDQMAFLSRVFERFASMLCRSGVTRCMPSSRAGTALQQRDDVHFSSAMRRHQNRGLLFLFVSFVVLVAFKQAGLAEFTTVINATPPSSNYGTASDQDDAGGHTLFQADEVEEDVGGAAAAVAMAMGDGNHGTVSFHEHGLGSAFSALGEDATGRSENGKSSRAAHSSYSSKGFSDEVEDGRAASSRTMNSYSCNVAGDQLHTTAPWVYQDSRMNNNSAGSFSAYNCISDSEQTERGHTATQAGMVDNLSLLSSRARGHREPPQGGLYDEDPATGYARLLRATCERERGTVRPVFFSDMTDADHHGDDYSNDNNYESASQFEDILEEWQKFNVGDAEWCPAAPRSGKKMEDSSSSGTPNAGVGGTATARRSNLNDHVEKPGGSSCGVECSEVMRLAMELFGVEKDELDETLLGVLWSQSNGTLSRLQRWIAGNVTSKDVLLNEDELLGSLMLLADYMVNGLLFLPGVVYDGGEFVLNLGVSTVSAVVSGMQNTVNALLPIAQKGGALLSASAQAGWNQVGEFKESARLAWQRSDPRTKGKVTIASVGIPIVIFIIKTMYEHHAMIHGLHDEAYFQDYMQMYQ
ncbi:unnamed protein product [Amoebophrya sp. A25]|nr:unnamed protein product [Amoebophrya sp. A25]|eukprot:GSA25T00004333001.1